jgi:hypothetical protein
MKICFSLKDVKLIKKSGVWLNRICLFVLFCFVCVCTRAYIHKLFIFPSMYVYLSFYLFLGYFLPKGKKRSRLMRSPSRLAAPSPNQLLDQLVHLYGVQ